MKDIRFICGHCGQHLAAPGDMAGTSIECPACRALIGVPPPLPRNATPRRFNWLVTTATAAVGLVLLSLGALVWPERGAASAGSDGAATSSDVPKAGSQLALDETPYAVKQAAGVDANLVFLRYVEYLASQWPTLTGNKEADSKSHQDFARRIRAAATYARTAKLDPELEQLAVSLQELLIYYIDRVREFEAIQIEAIRSADRDMMESSFDAGMTVGSTAVELDSAVAGLALGAFQMLLDSSARSQAREDRSAYKWDQAAKSLDAKSGEFMELFKEAARDCAGRHRWPVEETGADVPDSLVEQKNAAFNQRNWAAVATLLRSESGVRKQDPFACALAALYEKASLNEAGFTPSWAQSFQDSMLRAVSLLPDDPFYHPLRAEWMLNAGVVSLHKAATGAKKKGYVGGPYPCAEALRLLLAARSFDPYDARGAIRYALARAYASAGHYDRSIALYKEIEGLIAEDASACYNLTCVLSASGRSDEAIVAFEKTIRSGQFTQINWAKEDPDLAAVRKRFAQKFNELTTIRTRASIQMGVFNDDLYLVNESPFPLTNVRFTPRIVSGQQVYTKQLETAYLAPNTFETWVNAISVTGSRYDSYAYTVTCDQGQVSGQQ